MRDVERRIEALKDFLGYDGEVRYDFDPDKASAEMDNTFSVDDEEYLVLTYREAEWLAQEEVERLLEEEGIVGYSDNVLEYAISECSNFDWESAVEEDAYNYAHDFARERGNGKYANRLVEEAIESGVISEEDCEKDDDGTLYYEGNDLVERFADWYADKIKDGCCNAVEYLDELFGDSWKRDREWLDQNINYSALASWIVETDGVENTLARYDGRENEGVDSEGKVWYIYRVD